MGRLIREDWPSEDAPDIYFTRAYMALHGGRGSKPLLFRFESGGETYSLPYLETPLSSPLPEAAGLKDMETAYGYGGPVSTSRDPAFLAEAMAALADCCRERGVMAAFLRFHPLLENHGLAPAFQVFAERDTVAVDLSDADPWMNQISSKNRNMIRKAEREGLTVDVDPEFAGLAAFRDLYRETMDRLGADDFYRFDDAYFRGLGPALGRHGFLVHCRRGGEIIASAAIMTWGDSGHYHLSGSRREYQGLAPNNLMLYRALTFLKEKGLRRFHLGGGTTADPEDPLFKFKKAFSPRLCKFHWGRGIFLEREYARFKQAWSAANPEKAEAAGSRVLFYR